MASEELSRLVETRRDLHRHPELGYQEHRTAGIVAERLAKAGYDVRTGVAETGVVGSLSGSGAGPTVLLRADMDALPIEEQTTHDFPSTVPGRMHACGHDGHVAILLAVAERLAARRNDWKGSLRLVFQPAEEGLGGAARMADEGVLDGADVAMGLHLWSGLPSGVVGVVRGPIMAASALFRIEIAGEGGHGAIPEETVDAVVVAAHVVTALQQIVSRTISPLDSGVVTIGSVQAGSAPNIIAGRATLTGTVRAFQPATMRALRSRVSRVAASVAEAFGARATMEILHEDAATANTGWVADLVRESAYEVVGEDRTLTDESVRTMASEDFGHFLTEVPGCFFFVGAGNRETGAVHPHHSPQFDICEDALPVAVRVMEEAALRALRRTSPPA